MLPGGQVFTLTARRLRPRRLRPGKLNKRRGVGLEPLLRFSERVGGMRQ